MSRFSAVDQSRPVAMWLFSVALLVVLMIVVGGATRLTDSGLSITEWKPILGAVPPLSDAAWAEAFAKYRATAEYRQVNAGMSMEAFRAIFWWEWAHRLLGRLIGLAFFLPLVVFAALRQLPQRLAGPCVALLGLGALQGAVGWWMVTSGLADRVDVAPERLATHLGLALVILAGLVWTGLEALSGPDRTRSPQGWVRAAAGLLALIFVQALLGALVAGTDAGRIYTDWPTMGGELLAPVDWSLGARAFLHDQALVQFVHRTGAYVVLAFVTAYAILTARSRPAEGVGFAAYLLAGGVWLQAALGVATLMNAVPLWLGVLHQLGAAIVVVLATFNLWKVRRSQARLFSSRGL